MTRTTRPVCDVPSTHIVDGARNGRGAQKSPRLRVSVRCREFPSLRPHPGSATLGRVNPGMNTIEIEMSDGSISTWFVPSDELADEVATLIEARIGPPDSIKC